jgi:hypothetical protein
MNSETKVVKFLPPALPDSLRVAGETGNYLIKHFYEIGSNSITVNTELITASHRPILRSCLYFF